MTDKELKQAVSDAVDYGIGKFEKKPMTEQQRIVIALVVLITICVFCCIVLKGAAG